VPGYSGFIPQVASENLYGKSFAKTSAKAINSDFEIGCMQSAKEKYNTEQKQAFNKENHRELQNTMDPAEVRDVNDAYNFHDAEFQGIEIT